MIQIITKQTSHNLFILAFTILFMTTFLVQQVNSAGNCPSNISSFNNCINCADLGNGNFNCTCSIDDFYLVGACIEKGNPCTHTSLPLIFFSGSQFNLWEGLIGPFWYDLIINQVNPTNPFSPPFPVYLNNLNFVTMNNDQKSAWVQAYYFYLIFQTEINRLGAQKNLFIRNAVMASDTLINKTYNAQWNLINNFLNTNFNTSRTVLNFKQYVMTQAKKFMPCHDCKQNYGIIFVNSPQKFVCKQCPPRCTQCSQISTNLVCNSCIPGFFYNNITKKCDICSVSNCQSCSSVNLCSTCPSHQFLFNNTCSQCISQCASCSSNSEFCIECSTSFFSPVPTQGKCKVCQQIGCSYCTTNSSICAVCQKGYYINGTNCSKCSEHCTVCSNSINCGQCSIGYGVINRACYKCTDPYCAYCNGNATICTACTSSYTLNTTTKSCILKPIPARIADIKRYGCAQSYDNNNQYCFSCDEFYYQQGVYCKKCSPGCRSCLNRTVCYLCEQGFLLLNQTCVRCPVQCLSCGIVQSTQFCTSCRPGFFLVNNVLCTKIQDTDCLIRNPIKPTLCDVCKPGFVSTGRFGCIKCQIDCYWTCNPKNISQCWDTKFQISKSDYYNYGLQSQGCSLFVNGNCLQAEPGYLLVNTSKSVEAQFNPCFYPCDQCNITTRTCIKCVAGFSILNGRCQANLNCNPNCTYCPQGTERNLNNNTCVRCPARCQSCLNGICLQCFQGFYPASNGTCTRCPVRCFDCFDQTNCLSCERGYFKPLDIISHKEGNICLKCSSNCLSCRLQGDICTSCLPGLTLRNTRCIRPFVIQFEYTLDQPYAEFLQNSTSQKFFTTLAFMTSINPNTFYITSIKEGSTIIAGFVSVFTSTDANNTFYQLATSYIPGFPVIGYNVSYNNQTKSCSGSECSPFVGISTGLMIAIIAGSLCFVLLCAVNVYYVSKDCFRQQTINNVTKIVDPSLNNQVKTSNQMKTLNQVIVTQPEMDTNVKINVGDNM